MVFGVTVAACHSPTSNLRDGVGPDSWYQSSACPMPTTYVPQPTDPTDWPCPSASVIQDIDSQIALQFLQDTTAPTLVCRAADGSADLTRLQERAYQTLYLIKRLQFDAPLPWTSLSLWEWFTSNVHIIRYQGSEALCCLHLGDIPGARPVGFTVPGGVVSAAGGLEPGATLPGGFPTDVFGYVHEARHVDGYGHDCDGIRDRNIPELGAFGTQYYLGLWLANHATAPLLTTEERSYARVSSEELRASGGAFCTACGGI